MGEHAEYGYSKNREQSENRLRDEFSPFDQIIEKI